MSAPTWRPLPVVAKELDVAESVLYSRVRSVPAARRLLKVGARRVMFIDVERLLSLPNKARVYKSQVSGRWAYEVPMPDFAVGPVARGSKPSHAQALRTVEILIKAWWHR